MVQCPTSLRQDTPFLLKDIHRKNIITTPKAASKNLIPPRSSNRRMVPLLNHITLGLIIPRMLDPTKESRFTTHNVIPTIVYPSGQRR